MKNKGFTLIELLAVIVILAIIALIATPMILGVIDTARQGAAQSATLGYIDAIEKEVMISQFDTTPVSVTEGDVYTVGANGVLTKQSGAESSSATITADLKGDAPSAGTVTFGKGGAVASVSGLTFTNVYTNAISYTVSTNTFTFAS